MLKFEKHIKTNVDPFEFHRAKIPSGWILVMQYGGTSSGRLCFIPDPDHKWDGSSLSIDSDDKEAN
jgi:hypothetical protein